MRKPLKMQMKGGLSPAFGACVRGAEQVERINKWLLDPAWLGSRPGVVKLTMMASYAASASLLACEDREDAARVLNRCGAPAWIVDMASGVASLPGYEDLIAQADWLSQMAWLQRKVYYASRRASSTGEVADDTDELARVTAKYLAEDLGGEMLAFVPELPDEVLPPGMTPGRGRPRGFEAGVVAGSSLHVIDGKHAANDNEICKLAEQSRLAHAVRYAAKGIRRTNAVIALPRGVDVRSELAVRLALICRVVIVPTALPVRMRRAA